MGQCPMSPPSHDDDQSVLSRASSAASQPAFLVEHKFDGPERCILPHDDVLGAIEYQSLVKSRLSNWRKQQNRDGSFDVDEVTTQTDSVSLSDEPAPRVAAISAMSEAPTDATKKISNVDRVEPKQKFRARANANRGSALGSGSNMASIVEMSSGEDKALRAMTSFCSDASFVEHDNNDGEIDLPDHHGQKKAGILSEYYQKYQSHLTNDEQSIDPRGQDSITGGGARCLNPPLPPNCLGGAYGVNFRGHHEDSSAIHLNMKAHLVKFYQSEYLRAFPDSPQPKGMVLVPPSGRGDNSKPSSAPSQAPNLVSSESESTTSTSERSPSSSSVRLAVDNSPFLDLAISGSLGLVNGTPRTGSERKYLVLLNERNGAPLAVCALKSPHESPVVRIYTVKPRVRGQKPAASTGDVGLSGSCVPSMPLYVWAEFATEGEFPLPVRYSVYMSTGVEGKFEKEPSYKGSHPTPGSPEITVVGRTGGEPIYRGCCLLSIHSDETNKNTQEPYFRLSVSRGIDPALFICFAAIVDETVESTMRKQCKAKRRAKLKETKPNS